MSAVQIAHVQDGRLCIDTGALGAILDKAGDRPVAIVSVNGPLRSGKSYIINHFLRFLTAADASEDWFRKALPAEFHWRNSAERQTTGILAWSEPLALRRQGREVALLLVDTQGCFDDKTTTGENALIFAFSCLLSSVLVYNISNQVSEDMLQFLRMFAGHAQAVVQQGDRGALTDLVFLVRDWQCPGDFGFGYYDDRGSCSDRNFKREKLDPQPEMVAESRAVRQELLAGFRDVACCLMPYPGNDLAHHDKVDNVEPMFVQAVQDFVPRLFAEDHCIVKRIGHQEVTGTELKQLVPRWAELFSSADVPPVHSVAEATAEVQNAKASSVALSCYRNDMSNVVHGHDGLAEDQLWAIHAAKKQEALHLFHGTKRIQHQGVQQRYEQGLAGDLDGAFGPYRDINANRRQVREAREAAEAEARRIQEEAQRQIAEAQRQAEAARHQHRRRRKWYKF